MLRIKKTLLNFMVRPAYDNVLASLSILSSWGFTFEQQFKDEFSIPFYSLEWSSCENWEANLAKCLLDLDLNQQKFCHNSWLEKKKKKRTRICTFVKSRGWKKKPKKTLMCHNPRQQLILLSQFCHSTRLKIIMTITVDYSFATFSHSLWSSKYV